MRASQCLSLCSLAVLATFSWGCRAHPVSLTMMVIGDAVHDADVEERQDELQGKDRLAADTMFGARLETLVERDNRHRELLVYQVPRDVMNSSRYVVELDENKIVALSLTKRNIDGIEDVIKAADLRSKFVGKSPSQCQDIGNLGQPVLVLRSLDKDQLVRVYDVRNWTNLRGARYCILRFDGDGRCESLDLVGVSASTKEDPAQG